MKKQKNKLAGLQKRKAIAGYIFILPFIIGFLGFMVKPFVHSLYMSFCDVEVTPNGPINHFIGLDNYARTFLRDVQFNQLLTDELGRMVINALAIMVFSFFVALVLNQKFKGRALVRAIFFLPVILSSGVILGVEYDNTLLAALQDTIQESTGVSGISDIVKEILVTAGVGVKPFEIVFDIVDGIYDVAIASGIQIIIFLSGLQTISESMYEAAAIEGCTAWESLWKITFPMISSLFLVNMIYTIVDFSMRTDNEVMDRITFVMTVNLEYGFSSAMAWSYFAIVIAIIGLVSLIISKGVYYYE